MSVLLAVSSRSNAPLHAAGATDARPGDVRHFLLHLLPLALSACTESPEERFKQFETNTSIHCWSHFCKGGPHSQFPLPTVSTDDGVACMNDALASGAHAESWWAVEDSEGYRTSYTHVFAFDHVVTVFTSDQYLSDPPVGFKEQSGCAGPFRVGPSICVAGPLQGGGYIDVNALAWESCP
jgi:hypothetical protein